MTTPETQEVDQGLSEDQAASALLEKWGAKPTDEPKGEESEDESEGEQPQGDADPEEESEEETSESDDELEIDVAGEKFKVPAAVAETAKRIEAKVKEIEAGTTRKFQEAAELRKVAETQIQAAKQLESFAVEAADLIADHKAVTRRLEQLEKIDVNALAEQDPVQLTKINAEYNQLLSAKQRIESAYQQKKAQSQQAQEQMTAQRFAQLNEYAKRTVKGWSDDYSQKLLEFSVTQLGADPTQLRQIMSEPVIKALDLAYRGWKMNQTDPKSKQVQSTKTLKPGASGQMATNAAKQAEDAAKRLRKSGNVSDAANLLLARLNTKRR